MEKRNFSQNLVDEIVESVLTFHSSEYSKKLNYFDSKIKTESIVLHSLKNYLKSHQILCEHQNFIQIKV
jgi:hypothetical protein